MIKKRNNRNKNNNGRHKRMAKLLLSAIYSKNYQPMKARDLAYLLEIPKVAQKEMMLALDELCAERKVVRDEKGRYCKARFIDQPIAKDQPDRRKLEADMLRAASRAKGLSRAKQMDDYLDPGADLTEVLIAHGIPQIFPPKVIEQADRCPEQVREEDLEGRTDFRSKMVITIDGDDSKDFDDAVSLERIGSGYLLGVHIADVTHYVQASSALDVEALKRGTSVYIPDRVVPMLPHKLSNGICSLNEGVDRLTLSCIVRLDKDGHVTDSKICESVICSAHRMTYAKVDKILEKDKELSEEYSDIVPMLFDMRHLAQLMEANRRDRGMIDFELPEAKFILDENRHPVQIVSRMPSPATKLIEQFMLTANEIVAETYCKKNLPFVYRTHETPDEDKMETTLTAVREMGIPVQKSGRKVTPKEVQAVIAAAEGTPRESMIGSLILRSMQQARYSTENLGHFGLAAKYYCHFTSPIRRYPDLQIHRIIKDDLKGLLNGRKLSYYKKILEDVAWKSSALERRSVETEREADKVKMAEYVLDHLGEVTEAVVTGVTNWGIYVQRPDLVEGLVHVHELKGDYFEFDERAMTLKGKRSGRTFELGQKVRVKTIRADVARRIIDFTLADEDEE